MYPGIMETEEISALHRLPPELCINIFKRLDGCDLINLHKTFPSFQNIIYDKETIRYIQIRNHNVRINELQIFLIYLEKRPEAVEILDITGLHWIERKALARCIGKFKNLRSLHCAGSSLTLAELTQVTYNKNHLETVEFQMTPSNFNGARNIWPPDYWFPNVKNMSIFINLDMYHAVLLNTVLERTPNLEYLFLYSCAPGVQDAPRKLSLHESIREVLIIGNKIVENVKRQFENDDQWHTTICTFGCHDELTTPGVHLPPKAPRKEAVTFKSNERTGLGANESPPENSKLKWLVNSTPNLVTFELCVNKLPIVGLLKESLRGCSFWVEHANKVIACSAGCAKLDHREESYEWNEFVLQEMAKWPELKFLYLYNVHFYNMTFLKLIKEKCLLQKLHIRLNHKVNLFTQTSNIVKTITTLRDFRFDQPEFTVNFMSTVVAPMQEPTFIHRYHFCFARVTKMDITRFCQLSPKIIYMGGRCQVAFKKDSVELKGLFANHCKKHPNACTYLEFDKLITSKNIEKLPLTHYFEIAQDGRLHVSELDLLKWEC